MLTTDLIVKADKGAVIRGRPERSALHEYKCASLEKMYPGATSHPLGN